MHFSRKMLLSIILWTAAGLVYGQVHTSYLWHLEQPIYWPETSIWNPFQYQKVYESQYLKWNGGNYYIDGLQHPLNNLQEIFGNDDRKAVYQYRAKDAVQTLLGLPEAGAQVSYSGCLMENVKSLADAGQWGYSSGWQNNFITARGWTTSAGKPRMDMVGFTMNHALSPLVSDKVLRRQIQAHRYLYAELFGSNPNYSKGYWPAECAFSERNIKALREEGFEWSVIANSHLARTLNDYPLQYGTSGCNIDPPNRADKVSTNGNNWWSGQIDGRGGAFAAPYCYQAHKAKYVDPETGTEYKMTVVPMDDLLSYQNGYSLMGTGSIESHIAPYDNPAHPSMVLLAHDGDNAWGGGYDYYTQSVPGFANEAASKGYVPTTVEQFLTQHPVPETDVVHVEDGSWFNAANDWGHPQFINWLWPMYTSNYEFDPNGWTEDARNWAVLVAAENRVQMAEDLQGSLNIANIVNPSAMANAAERAWHYLLPAYNSGYMYYGTSLDMEVKQSLACNRACVFANQIISAHPGVDNTPPSVFIPQRYPYNPGGTGFGPNYAYQQHANSTDFHVWTFAYDVSGVQSAILKYRTDVDGNNPVENNENETYAGGSSVEAWQSVSMSYRNFPTGNVANNPEVSFFMLPDYIAGEYYGSITGLTEKLVDYYVEVTDANGNIFKTPIQHVYVGTASPTVQTGISWTPQNPTVNDIITITENNQTQGANLHWGVKLGNVNWQLPDTSYWPDGTTLFNGTGPSLESVMAGPGTGNINTIQLGPFNNPAQTVNGIDFVMHYNNNTWNNNNGSDFHISLSAAQQNSIVVAPSAQAVPAVEGSYTLTVTCDTSWTAVSDQSWCVVSGAGTGNGTFTATISTNSNTSLRTAHITVSGPGMVSAVSTITQLASTPAAFRYTIANDLQTSDRSFEFDLLLLDTDASSAFELGTVQAGIMVNPAILNGGTMTASIVPGSSSLDLSQQPSSVLFSQSQNCLKLAPKSPPGIGNGSILSTDQNNPSRLCRIKLLNSLPFAQYQPNLSFNFTSLPYPTKISEYTGGINTALTTNTQNCFSQCVNALLNPPPFIFVTPEQHVVEAEAGSFTFDIQSNAGWTAVSDQSWCIVTSTGFGNGSFTANFQENTSSSQRTATITVYVNGLPDHTVTLIQNGISSRLLQLNLYLEGLYSGSGIMLQAMDQNGPKWMAGIADKISIELHQATDYNVIVYSLSGIELSTSGVAEIAIPAGFNGSYYLTIRHRNSIESVSSLPVSFSGNSVQYSMDTPDKVFGGNLKLMGDGNYAIWGGDADQDGLVDSSDMLIVDNDANAFVSGYLLSDLNGDGLTDASDMILLDNNASWFVSKSIP
ncbi:MAG: hypothetical protein IPH88_07550 [Bacteroidales bacterium]|nr:hypothetical protein [Bacteroidales bacterium]